MKRRQRKTRAREALASWMARTKTTQGALALRLGVTQALVSYWLAGRARPSPKRREALRQVTKIPVRDWLDDGERGEIDKLTA